MGNLFIQSTKIVRDGVSKRETTPIPSYLLQKWAFSLVGLCFVSNEPKFCYLLVNLYLIIKFFPLNGVFLVLSKFRHLYFYLYLFPSLFCIRLSTSPFFSRLLLFFRLLISPPSKEVTPNVMKFSIFWYTRQFVGDRSSLG